MRRRDDDEGCRACRLIRVYLMVAGPVLLMLWLRPEIGFLKGVDLVGGAATLIGIAFCVVVAWKAWREFGDRRRR